MRTSLAEGDDAETSLAWITVAELVAVREDFAETRVAFLRYFRRGLKRGLSLGQLMDLLPRVFAAVEYPLERGRSVLNMLKALTPREIGEGCDGFESSADNRWGT